MIVEAHHSGVLRFAKRFLANDHDAEDATQEVFLKAYRSLSRFSLDRSFRPWLYTIAMNQFRTFYGTMRKLRDSEEELIEAPDLAADDPERQAEANADRAAVRGLVNRLPSRLRQVVILYYFQDLSISETAEALGVAPNTVKSALQRARSRLLQYSSDGGLDHWMRGA
jgi:RNA polymerase sigma-70 factor (ECF subfamily)